MLYRMATLPLTLGDLNLQTNSIYTLLADRTIGRAFGTLCRLSVVCLSVTFCIVVTRRV